MKTITEAGPLTGGLRELGVDRAEVKGAWRQDEQVASDGKSKSKWQCHCQLD